MSGILGSIGGGTPTFDFSMLADYYNAQNQLRALSAAQNAGVARPAAAKQAAEDGFAPWSSSQPQQTDIAKLRAALEATSFVDLRDSSFDKAGVPSDSKKLFALYTGLTKLQTLAQKAAQESTSSWERAALDRRFQAGLAEIKSFVTEQEFEDLTLLFGDKAKEVDSRAAMPRAQSAYQGNAIVQGASGDAIAGLTGNEVFTVTITKSTGTTNVTIDLSQIGGTPSVDNIIAYANEQLAAQGIVTRFKREVFDGPTATSPKKYGLGIQGVATERVSLSAAAASPALYLAGVAGSADTQSGQLVKVSDQGTSVKTEFSTQITATGGVAEARATAVDAEGNAYVVGTATGDVDLALVQGDQDVFLRKYDSAGKLVWSRLLGSSARADGFSVAVDAGGNVAIAGRITDRLSAKATGGGNDSFVAKYNSNGDEIFARQIAPVLDDQANALAFDADGSLYIAGQTKSAMASGIVQAGGNDAYLMKLMATGTLAYVRQFGGAGDDRASAVTVDENGAVLLATVESGVAVVRKLDPNDGLSAPLWEKSLGLLGEGSIGGLVAEDGAVYIGGTTTNASLTAGGEATIANALAGGADGFVMKLADNGAGATADFVSYIGTGANDGAAGIAVNNGEIYVAGSTGGSLSGGTAPAKPTAYAVKLDETGAQVWSHQYESTLGTNAARGIAIDVQGGSVLDRLGLPRGEIDFEPSRLVTSQTSVRAGDYFYVKVNDHEARKITVQAGDTLRSLVTRINGVLMLKGEASVTRGARGDQLNIEAKDGTIIEISRGDGAFDALAGLGIEPQKLYNTGTDQSAGATAKDKNVFALGIGSNVSLTRDSDARLASMTLNNALQALRNAYQGITSPASATTASSAVGAGASTAVSRQLANYQSALAIFGR